MATERTERTPTLYWINISSVYQTAIHVEGCRYAVSGMETLANWHGVYASRGAAIDAALAFGRPIRECTSCIVRDRIVVVARE